MSGTVGAREIMRVTGASGYVASWLIKLLLRRGYTVKASLRDPDDPKKTGHLLALNGAKDRLRLFKASLLEEGSFDPVVEGCVGIFHTASPFRHDVKDPQAELLDPAVKGTLNVLKSCSKIPSVQHVVLTSSMAAVAYNGIPTRNVVVDESWFSDPNSCRQTNTLAKDTTWKFAKEKGIDMVTINPAMMIGLLLQPTLNTSATLIANLINSALAFPNASFGWVNFRDVVNAHIMAFDVPSAGGRNCLYERFFMPTYWASKEKVKSLGIDNNPLEQSLKETVESLKEKGFVNF
ncbi:hypothetical protein BT93_B3193 [Corymbia citriodora subsp. variegata]|nr:hypothetical protein BT93_B3193 [Corymbia citriodora subsp. variegata]